MPRTSPQPRRTGALAHRAIEDRILGRAAEAVRKAETVTSPKRRAAIVRGALKDIAQLAKAALKEMTAHDRQWAPLRQPPGVDVSPDDERAKRLASFVRQATAMVEQLRPPTEA